MDRNKILASAAALVLTVTGGVSALFLTVGAADGPATPAATTEVIEYVDAAGNPLPASTTGVAATGSPNTDKPVGTEGEAYEEEEEEDEEHEEEHEYEDEDDDDD